MKKTLKRLLPVGLAICMSGFFGIFAACAVSGSGSDSDSGSANNTAAESYTVTFDVQGHGAAPSAQTVNDGEYASAPNLSDCEGYTTADGWLVDGYYFVGWYKEAEGTTPFDFTSEAINADTTVYAKWIDTNTPPTLSWNDSAHIYISGHEGTINNTEVYNKDDAHKWEYTNNFTDPPTSTTYYYNEVTFTGAVKLMWHLDECQAGTTYKLDIRLGDTFAQDSTIRSTYLCWAQTPSAEAPTYNSWNRTFGLIGLQIEFTEDEVGAGKMCSVILMNPANEEVTLRIICAVGDAH